jgi:HD superfamily phosphohydrolase YqeK
MDERLKRIKELSKKINNYDDKTKKIVNDIIKKYPELKSYEYKSQNMKIHIGTSIKYVSNDMNTINDGIVSSIKYHNIIEKKDKTIKYIIVSKEGEHWKKLYPAHFYFFVNDSPESNITSLIKSLFKEKFNITDDDKYMLEQAEIYCKNIEKTKE